MAKLKIDILNSTGLMVWFSVVLFSYMVVSFNVYSFLQPLSFVVFGFCWLNFILVSYVYFKKLKMSSFGFVTASYMVLIIAFTIINANDIKQSFYNAMTVFYLLMLFAYYEHKYRELLMTLAAFLSLCIYMNLSLMIIFPEWMFAAEDEFDSFILGGNYNQMGCRFICGILTSVLCVPYSKKWIINTICLSITAVVTLILVGSMTALSNIILLSLICLVPFKRVLKIILISFFIFYLFFQCIVCFSGEGLQNNELAVYIIEDLLGKDLTFTNRTEMWDSAGKMFAKSPIIGYGCVDAEWYVTKMNSFAIGPHNFIYGILINGGLVGISVFIGMFIFAVKNILKKLDRIALILLLGLVTMLFMMCFEVYQMFYPVYLFCLIYYYPKFYTSQTLKEETAL